MLTRVNKHARFDSYIVFQMAICMHCMYGKQTLENGFWTGTFLNGLFIISFCSTIFKVSIWPMHCSLGNQNTITCKLELHAIQLKGKCTSLYAKGPQGPGIQG